MHIATGLLLLLAGAAALGRSPAYRRRPSRKGAPRAPPARKATRRAQARARKRTKTGKSAGSPCVGGDVHTGTGAVLRGATVLAQQRQDPARSATTSSSPEGATVTRRHRPARLPRPGRDVARSGLIGGSSGDFDDTVDPFNSRMVLGARDRDHHRPRSRTAARQAQALRDRRRRAAREVPRRSQSYTPAQPARPAARCARSSRPPRATCASTASGRRRRRRTRSSRSPRRRASTPACSTS